MPNLDDALEIFHDIVRARWNESAMSSEVVALAKALCKAEGRDPDRVVIGGNRMVFAKDGFGGALIAEGYMFHPAWAEYWAMAETAMEEFQGLIEETNAKNQP